MADDLRAGGWPDPERPGVPLNPERTGYHWLDDSRGKPQPVIWDHDLAAWCDGSGAFSPQGIVEMGFRYYGPCLTPAEVAQREAAARKEAEAERDELFNRLGRVTESLDIPEDSTAGRILDAIREREAAVQAACASVSVRVEVPEGAEAWSPLEAWEEALAAFDTEFRAAIRQGDKPNE